MRRLQIAVKNGGRKGGNRETVKRRREGTDQNGKSMKSSFGLPVEMTDDIPQLLQLKLSRGALSLVGSSTV